MLKCPCGYEMCYLCRADVHGVGYRHFCQHLRLVPGSACTTCRQCNLYETEDEQAVAKDAARRAAQEWAASHVGSTANAPSVGNVVPIARESASFVAPHAKVLNPSQA